MAEEVNAGAAAAGGAGAADSGGSSGGMTAEQIAAPGGDVAFLEQPETVAESAKPADKQAEAAKGADEGTSEEIDLSSLEEGAPEWLAKVTDPSAKAEVEKLLALQKSFSERFKDAEDLAAFFKDLPGGREQVAALQTLSQEVAELDEAIESNTPEGNATVAERYLDMTPDGGVGLLRAAAQHMAKSNPEAWGSISQELVNSTLRAAGIGADLAGITGAIAEMKAAVAADDGEAFGKAAGKLLGAPKAEPGPAKPSKEVADREAARQDAARAQTDSWQMRSEKSGNAIDTHMTKATDAALAKVLPASISEKDRTSLRTDIAAEVMSQIVSDAWLSSQVKQLIGWSTTGPKGKDYANANLRAQQADWDKATELVTNYATPKLIAKAVAKVVSKWSRDRAASNKDAREKARAAGKVTDIGAAPGGKVNNGRKVLTQDMLKGPNALTDEEILNF